MNTNERIVIIGRSGYIAQALSKKAVSSGFQVLHTSSSQNKEAMNLDFHQPEIFDYAKLDSADTVILLAAMSSPDLCEDKKIDCWDVNVTGTSYFISECLKRDVKVIFASTDLVYGETQTAVSEDHPTNPCGYYAKSKSTVEKRFLSFFNFKSLRFSYVYSDNDKFTSYLEQCLINNETADVYHPLSRCIIDLNDLIDSILKIVLCWNEIPSAAINISGTELLSRLDIATAYNHINDNRLKINVVKPSSDFYHARPSVINLNNNLLCDIIGRSPKKINEMLLSWQNG